MKLSRLIFLMLVGLISSAVAATPVVSPSTAFTPAQQVAIDKIIHDYLVNHPEVLIEAGQALQMKQQQIMQEKAAKIIPAVSSALLHDPSSPIVGNPKATVSVVEFFDYQCPHCKVMEPEVTKLLATDKNVRWVYKQLPIFGADSEFAARAALAAQRQGKYEVFHNALLNEQARLSNQSVLDIAKSVGLDTNKLQADMNQPMITQEIQAAATLANQIGVVATPVFVFINEKDGKVVKSLFVPGQITFEELEKNIQLVK